MNTVLDEFNAMVTFLNKRNEQLIKEISTTDRTITDVEHIIELGTFNACQGYVLAKRLQLLLKQRREVKNEREQIQSLIQTYKNWSTKRKEKTYTLREMSINDDLVKLIKGQKVK